VHVQLSPNTSVPEVIEEGRDDEGRDPVGDEEEPRDLGAGGVVEEDSDQ